MGHRILSRLTAGIIIFSILLIGIILYWSINEIFSLTDTTISGEECIAALRRVNGLTNKLLTTDNLHITIFNWEEAAAQFVSTYYTFIKSHGLNFLLRDANILYHYKAFRILSLRALNSIKKIKQDYTVYEKLPSHSNRGLLLQPGAQRNKVIRTITASTRRISNYFSSSYENTITPLVVSLKNIGRQVQMQILTIFSLLAISIISVTVIIYVILKRKENERISKIIQIETEKNKLESIGLFASGIAHDFNNFLASIIGNISVAKTYVSPQSELFTILGDAEKASNQATGLTEQFLTFATGGSPIKELSDIRGIIEDTCAFMLRGSKIKCECTLPEGLWNVEIDKDKIYEVINNIVLNSMQAMPDGGLLHIFAENVMINKKNNNQYVPGHYLHISISDSGQGIPKHIQKNIFNPYFTTKEKGSGLGLAVSYSIIKKHHGYINFESKENAGTTFHIYLKASLQQLKPAKIEKNNDIHGHGRILVLDDQQIIRRTAERMLRMLGFTPVVATNGEEAIELFRKSRRNHHRFTAVILDLTIRGGMGGEQVLKSLRQIDPDIFAIVSSGYSHDDIMAKYKEHGFNGILKKPYTIDDLSKILSRVGEGNIAEEF